MKLSSSFAILALLFLPATPAGAQTRSAPAPSARDEFTLGCEAYRKSRSEGTGPAEARALLEEARERFARIAASGIDNGIVYYNLGNVHYKLGQTGKAVASYLRAKDLIRSPDLDANLNLVRSSLTDHVEHPGPHPVLSSVLFWHYRSTLGEMESAAVVLYLLLFAFAAGALRFRPARIGVLACAVLLVPVGGSYIAKVSRAGRERGVVMESEAPVMSEPGARSVKLFVLHEGAEVEVKRRSEDGRWFEVEFSEDLRGWIESRYVEELWPSRNERKSRTAHRPVCVPAQAGGRCRESSVGASQRFAPDGWKASFAGEPPARPYETQA